MSVETPALKLDPHWPADHARAVQWAAGRVAAHRAQPVAVSGWSASYCLSGPEGKAYLKLLPPVQRHQVAACLSVAQRFADHVPQVIASDSAEGWLLVADHQGRELDGAEQYNEAARCYGRMQGEASGDSVLQAQFERIALDQLWPRLQEFLARPLAAEVTPGEEVGGAYFMGPEDAERYLRLLQRRAQRLQALVGRAHVLPSTLDHGDLNDGNLAFRDDGRLMFIDWDDAAIGPAGLGLHSLFSGCVLPIMQLQRLAEGLPPSEPEVTARLQAFMDGLVATGYTDRSTLLQALPGALCAGVMRFVAHFGRFPGEGQRAAAGRTIRHRLSGLLDLCDWLAAREPAMGLADAEDYEADHEWRRAMRLVQDALARSPQTPTLLAHYGLLALRSLEPATAHEAFDEALQAEPEHLQARLGLARLHMTRLALAEAADQVGHALRHHPDNATALALRERIAEFEQVRAASQQPKGMGRIRVTAEERRQGYVEPDTLALMIEQFNRHGALQLDEVFEPTYIEGLRQHFEQRYGRHFHDGHHPHALRTGDKRYMLTLELDKTFGDPALLASGLLMPFVRAQLGDSCVMSTCTAVISLPGARDQRMHKDFSPLFEEKGARLRLPCWSLQAIVPLVAMDAQTGATAICTGTQHRSEGQWRLRSDVHVPVVPLGSVLLVDYKTAHAGRANRSDRVRPIVCLAYARPWFRDSINHDRQPPLRFEPGYVATAPKRVLDLVGWWSRDLTLAQIEV